MIRLILCILFIILGGETSAHPAVMRVVVYLEDGSENNIGSAVLTQQESGCLVTNQHVVVYTQTPGAKMFLIFQGTYYRAYVREEHSSEDLALICFNKKPEGLPPAIRQSSGRQIRNVTMIGFPFYTQKTRVDAEVLQQSLPLALGEVTAAAVPLRDIEYTKLDLQKKGAVNPKVNRAEGDFLSGTFTESVDIGKICGGASGGAFVDNRGQLLGITTLSRNDGTGMLAIPASKIPKSFFE